MLLVVEGGGNCVPMYSNKCSEIGKCFWLSVVGCRLLVLIIGYICSVGGRCLLLVVGCRLFSGAAIPGCRVTVAVRCSLIVCVGCRSVFPLLVPTSGHH